MCQEIGTIDAGVVLVIEITISLGTDQVKKTKQASFSSFGHVTTFQLDAIKSVSSQKHLIKHITSMSLTTNFTIY